MIFQNALFHNICELVSDNICELVSVPAKEGLLLRRIPREVCADSGPGVGGNAFRTAGCEIRFIIREGFAEVTLGLENSETNGESRNVPGLCEIYHGNFQETHVRNPVLLTSEPITIKISNPPQMRLLEKIHQEQGLPFDPAVVRVILPYNKQTRFYNIQGDIAPPGSHQLPSRTLLTYGSSITQGYTASLPTGTYAMQLARHLSADLLNRGVAGAAQMEPAMAKMIAGAPWDMALLEMGINVFGTWDEETYSRRISEFIDIIVRAHPDRWVFCIDLYTHTGDFTCNPKTASFRNILQKKAESLQAEGYQKIRHIRGDSILDISSGLTIDLVHPANPGMERMALNLADRILKLTSPV